MEKIYQKLSELHIRYSFYVLFIFLLFALNFSFLVYILIIARYDLPFADDYVFFARLNRFGFLGSIQNWYLTWQGRVMPYFLINSFLLVFGKTGSLFAYIFFISALGVLSIYRVSKHIIARFNLDAGLSGWQVFNFSFLIFNVWLISNFEPSTFFWLNVSCMYFGGIIMLLIGIGSVINNKSSLSSYIITAVGFLYAGSSSEHIGVFVVFSTMILVMMLKYPSRLFNLNSDRLITKKLSIALIFAIIGFILMIAAPGNAIRMAYFANHHSDFIFIALRSKESLAMILLTLMTDKWHYFLILFFPMILAGSLTRNKVIKFDYRISLRIILFATALLFFLYFAMMPMAYAQGGMGPLRALTYIPFLFCISIASLGFIIGNLTMFPRSLALSLSLISMFGYSLVIFYSYTNNVKPTIIYAKSEMRRIHQLMELQKEKNNNFILLDSLISNRNNVFIYSELAKDSTDNNNYWINQGLCDYLNLDFKIGVKSKQ